MTESQPIVCAFLRLPPEQQPFFRMKELSYVFLQKLNHLSLALAVSEDPHTLTEAKQTLHDLREVAGDQCNNLAAVMYFGLRFANKCLELLGSLIKGAPEEETVLNFTGIHSNAGYAAGKMEETQKGMIQFGQEVGNAVRRITTTLNGDKKNLEMFTAENSQAVTDLLQAVDECSTLLQQIIDYYREMEVLFADHGLIKSTPPSEEEIKFMQERWKAFAKSVADIKGGFGILRSRLLAGPDIGTSYDSPDPRTAQSTTSMNAPGRPENEARPKAILDATASGTTPPDPSSPRKPKSSFFISSLHRLLSCLRLKQID